MHTHPRNYHNCAHFALFVFAYLAGRTRAAMWWVSMWGRRGEGVGIGCKTKSNFPKTYHVRLSVGWPIS